jgi:hypothetical protein
MSFPVGITREELAEICPRAYHLTHVENWDLIQRIGLLSTTALLDLFGFYGEPRHTLESRNRRELVPLRHEKYGLAILRDQKPMDDKGLERALTDGIRPEEWYQTVNAYTFFWVNRGRVDRLLAARAYRKDRHALLTVRTVDLLQRRSDRAVLSPLNTGATRPMPHPRGRNCFVPLASYPFSYWRHKRNVRDAVVELAIKGSVPDLVDALERVSIVGGGKPEELLWATN